MIDLAIPGYVEATIDPVYFGGPLTPPLGGPVQQINRLGTRFRITFVLPPLRTFDVGRRLMPLIMAAKEQGARVAVPLASPLRSAPGMPLVNGAIAGAGSSITIRAFSPNFVVRQGDWLSVRHGGRRYLYLATAQSVAGLTGLVTVPVFPSLRTSLADGDIIDYSSPKIEGLLDGTTFGRAAHSRYQATITVTESA